MKKLDYIIVGQGLAGSLMAIELLKRERKILVVNNEKNISASSVAAGMYNPMVYKRITKTWMADKLIPELQEYYADLQKILHVPLLFPVDSLKLLSAGEFENWKTKYQSGKFSSFIKNVSEDIPVKGLKNFAGHAQIAQSGYVDLRLLVSSIRKLLKPQKAYVEGEFRYEDVKIKSDSVGWNGYESQKIIFCEGSFAINNQLFDQVSYYLTKGDVLEIRIDNFQQDYIVNKQIFILPKGGQRYVVGSTYNWSGLDFEKNPKNVEFLKEKIDSILDIPYEVLTHNTAIRPTVKDRRPVLGQHPVHSNVFYFNGLGTKGVMLAPHFARQMVEFIEYNKPLNPEVFLERF